MFSPYYCHGLKNNKIYLMLAEQLDPNRIVTKSFMYFRTSGLSYSAIQRPDYDDTPNPEFLNQSWMASIPDDQPLSELTMPGTHNSMALYGGVYAECQTWSLPLQLLAGIRFLDIHVRYVKGNLTIHHGVSYQQAHFGHVLEAVADFLHKYPTETVLMRVKEEFSETNNIYGAVVDYIHRHAQWNLLWHSRLVPTMAEARGKLIILQDFAGPDLGMRYGSLDIADDWKVGQHLTLSCPSSLPFKSAVLYRFQRFCT